MKWTHHIGNHADAPIPEEQRLRQLILVDRPNPSLAIGANGVVTVLRVPQGKQRPWTLRLWIEGDYLHTYATGTIDAIERAKTAPKSEHADGCLATVLHEFVEAFTPMLNESMDLLEECEQITLSQKDCELAWTKLQEARRLLLRIGKLAMQRSILDVLADHPIINGNQARIKISAMRLDRIYDDCEFMLERADHLRDELQHWKDGVSDQYLNRITVFGVLFMPINLLAGMCGMNVGGIPFANSPHGFWLIALTMAIIVALQIVWLRRNKYLQ